MPHRSIALDFDGVIHDYSLGYTGHVPEGGPLPGALEFVQELLREGWSVYVHTCRALPEQEGWKPREERVHLHHLPIPVGVLASHCSIPTGCASSARICLRRSSIFPQSSSPWLICSFSRVNQ